MKILIISEVLKNIIKFSYFLEHFFSLCQLVEKAISVEEILLYFTTLDALAKKSFLTDEHPMEEFILQPQACVRIFFNVLKVDWLSFNIGLKQRWQVIAGGLGFIPKDDPNTYLSNFDPPRRELTFLRDNMFKIV